MSFTAYNLVSLTLLLASVAVILAIVAFCGGP